MNQPALSAHGRDLRLDFFRGLALACIFIDHIPDTVLARFTLHAVGFSDAAEVFIFISGYSAALAYGAPLDQRVADVQVCVDALKNKGPVFIVGYCYGGSVVWAAACRCTGLAAASSYYGKLAPEMADETPKCPTICHFGKKDAGIPLDGVEKFAAKHPEVAVYLYDAGHGFNSDRPTHHDAAAAKLARERTLALFRANGK